MNKYFFLITILLNQFLLAETGSISGIIKDKDTKQPLAGANIVLKEKYQGTTSDKGGIFILNNIKEGSYQLEVSFLGYKEYLSEVRVESGETTRISIELEATPLKGKEVLIVATRAIEGETPTAFSTLTNEEIQKYYYAQDIPVMLSELPSTKFYSESGNGIGYNYMSIRGFDQRRISVIVNGVPQNDPEDHNVYWIDFPDLLGNIEDIQVQRGAGNAFYGPPTIGGSVNIITSQFSSQLKINGFVGIGDYNTQKYSVSMNSGLIANKYVLFGRVSRIKSDGYRDRSWVDFWNFFLGAAMYTQKNSLRLHFYGGPIKDGLAYGGLPKLVNNDLKLRRKNYSYWELDSTGSSIDYAAERRDDEIENFNQPHIELIHEFEITPTIKLNNTLFGIRGYGFYDYDGSWAPMSYFRITPEYGFDLNGEDPENVYVGDLLIRAYVDNKQVGWMPQLQWAFSNGKLITGGEFRIHRSLHWGRIQKGSEDLPPAVSGDYSGLNYIAKRRYYEYKGAKDIFSPYIHLISYITPNLKMIYDIQYVYNKYRLYDEKFIGNDFLIKYHFINPRFGINFKISNLDIFTSYAITTREPRLKNFYDAAEASTPASWGAVAPQFELFPDGTYNFKKPLVKPETLNDFEIGVTYQYRSWKVCGNYFYMSFADEIIKKGQLDRFGQPITGNADKTLHQGVELAVQGNLTKEFSLMGNLTTSKNELKRYSIFDYAGNEIKLDGNPIAGFPNLLANLRIDYGYKGFQLSLGMQHVGKQYTDNFKDEKNTVEPYTVYNGTIGYQFKPGLSKINIFLQLFIRNIFDKLYIMHGESDEFFPAAERNIFFNVKFSM
jgi:iron complex outermembrane receptor protein